MAENTNHMAALRAIASAANILTPLADDIAAIAEANLDSQRKPEFIMAWAALDFILKIQKAKAANKGGA